MMKNKMLLLVLVIALMAALTVGCNGTTPDEKGFKDGHYFAMDDKFSETSGWKSTVMFEVVGGKIKDLDWNAVSIKGGLDKKTASIEGKYPMVEVGGAQATWHEQAEKVEAYLLDKQDPKDINYSDDEGHTDAISGVSVHVNDMFGLVDKALAAGPAEIGMYKDGAYHAEEKEFSENGWKSTIDITVMNGDIVSVNWNAVHNENEQDKKTASIEGNYPMVENGGAKAHWHEQAAEVEAYLIDKQDPKPVEYSDDEGHTDAIAGVTVHVNDFFGLAEEALANAK